MRRFMAEAGADAPGVRRPNRKAAERFRDRLCDALNWIDRRAPDLAAEFQATIEEIVLAAPDWLSRHRCEGWVSDQLPGVLVLNAEGEGTRAGLVLTLAREQARAVLLGECGGGRLIEAPETERVSRPGRKAKRPLEAVIHAGFAACRALWVLDHMEDDPGFGLAEQIEMATARAEAMQVLTGCLATVRAQGQLTPKGARLVSQLETALADWQAAERQYMAVS
ncbi:MAG: HEXXH motif-containing putative peptide modification protein, partial [Pseudomonadota bacterium]